MRSLSTLRLTQPSIEAVELWRVKENARITIDDDDRYLVEQVIPAARQWVETHGGVSLVNATWRDTFGEWDTALQLGVGPLVSVSQITYLDTDGANQTLSSSLYRVDTDRRPGQVIQTVNSTYPRALTESIKVDYTAGFGTSPSDVPAIWLHAVEMLATYWYETREAFAVGQVERPLALSLENMIFNAGGNLRYA